MKKHYLAIFIKRAFGYSSFLFFFLTIFATLRVNAQGNRVPLSFKNSSQIFTRPLDANPPVITYTPLASTCATGSRTLTATITDVDGVPTTGAGRPVLYWQINSGVPVAVTGVSIGSNQFTFTFGTGAIAGNLVSYYIVAQDNAGNVTSKPLAGASGFSINPPAVAAAPTTPDFYVIQTTLTSGTYNVGSGQAYTTITDAVNAYNNSCLSGPVTFLLTDASYNTAESFPVTISNPAASSVNTLTIKPGTGITTIIQGSAADALFKFNGSDYITIDGPNSSGTTRNLTIANVSTSLTSAIIWIGSVSASNGATHNTIKNCVLTGNSATTTFAGILSSSGIVAGNVAETANSDNTYQNNSISASYYGMMLIGPAGGESNTVITGNSIGSTLSTKKLGYRGVLISNQTNFQLTNNNIIGIVSTFGIGSDTDPSGGVIISGAISGGVISGNLINDIKNTNNSGWPAYGISLQSTTAACGIKIYNNFLHSITGNGNSTTAANNGNGINIQSGGGYSIFFNSINLFINQSASSGGISSCIFIGPGVTGTASVDIRDNILSNRRTTGTNYAIYCSVPNLIFSNINFNDYYSTSFVGYLGSVRTNIAAWQTATGNDGSSVSVNPIFNSTTDLHLQLISPLNDQGTPVGGITTDIDGTTRSTTVPDIGADEFTPPVCSGNTGGTVTSDFINVCTSGSVSLSATGFSYGLGIAYQWEKSTDNFATAGIVVTGETNPTSANPPTITTTTWYRLRVTCSAGSPGYSNSLKITVYNPNILTTTAASRCGPGTVNLSATGTPTTAIQWYATSTGGAPLYTGSPFTTPSISATTTYYAESTYLGSSGTVGLNTPNDAAQISNQFTSWQVYFNVIQATKLLTLDVYPMAIGENSTIDVYNSSGGILASVFYTTTVSGGATAQTVTMNVSLPIGTGYYLYATNGLPPSGLTRNLTGAVYPYNSSDIIITGNEFNSNFYMCYYRWRFSNGCSSSPRTAVTAIIGTTATLNISATPAAICAGSSTNLNVTSSNGAFVYTWVPGNLTGASQTVSPAVTTTYTVSATDGTCTASGNVTVTVNPASSNVVITPAAVNKCAGNPPALLMATGGDITGIPVLSENFNGASIPSGWSTATTGSTGAVAASAWTLRPDGYAISGNTFHSNDNTQFYLSNSDANAGITRTTLSSPAFSLVGYTSASLSFWHYYGASGSAASDSITVEISQNGTSWTSIYSNHLGKGASTIFGNTVVNLTSYIGQSINYIRFRYFATYDYQWAIDNVSITGSNSGAPITWSPVAGLYTNAAGTIVYTGGATPTVYANPLVSTIYTATATPVNACQKSQTVAITLRTDSAYLTASPNFVCPSGASTISISFTGTGPWNLTYTDGTTPVTVNNIATSPYTFVVNPLVTTSYSVTTLSDAYCTATAGERGSPVTVNVNPSAYSTWLGVSTVWTDPANWCGGVPTATKDVIIPTAPNYPVITGTTSVAHDISIAVGASLTISTAAVFSFKGTFINNGTLTNNGTIVLNGSAVQTFPNGTTGTIANLNNLEVNNSAGATINKDIIIKGLLKPTAGAITLNNIVITLHSDASGTASVGTLGGSASFVYSGTGAKFVIERYISSATKTGWRFLSAPLAAGSPQTINQAWQEGQIPGTHVSTGYGMQITGPASAGAGFDINTTTPSVKTYNPLTLQWKSIPGTSGTIATTEGYMAFIRGDRGSYTFGSMSPTTLRTTGAIKTGPVGPIGTPLPGGFISVGNPYPSAIDFTTTTRVGLQNTYYLWDPKLGTYGGYQTFTGPSYTPTPGNGSYGGGNKFIESGQAFFVIATIAPAPHNISFSESNKVTGSFQVARQMSATKQLRTQLSGLAAAEPNLIDGVLFEFDNAYSAAIDDLDAPKLINFGENLGIRLRNELLSVERRPEINNEDTLFYQLDQLKQQRYRLDIIPENIAATGLTAYMHDNYLNLNTIIPLDISTPFDFTVTADAASKASNRFMLIFKLTGPLPVTFTSIAAYQKQEEVIVTWKVEDEIGIDHYDVERSVTGNFFTKIGSVAAQGNSGSLVYTFPDVNPLPENNFYRIKSVANTGEIAYSSIVKVNIAREAIISVYPNPVKEGVIIIHGLNLPKSDVDIHLINSRGQLVLSQQANFPAGNNQVSVLVPPGLAKGFYTLEIMFPQSNKKVFKIIIE